VTALRARAAAGALLACLGALPLLSGCTLYDRVFHRGAKLGTGCHEKPFRGNAESRPGLTVPEGLSAPDTRNAVKVPALGPSEQDSPTSQPCLAQPPNFFAKSLLPGNGKQVAPAPAAAAPAAPASATPLPAPTTPMPSAPAPAAPSAPAAPAGGSPDVLPPG
jgi:hypothetical protein